LPYGGRQPGRRPGFTPNQVADAVLRGVLPVLGLVRGGNLSPAKPRPRPPLASPAGRGRTGGRKAASTTRRGTWFGPVWHPPQEHLPKIIKPVEAHHGRRAQGVLEFAPPDGRKQGREIVGTSRSRLPCLHQRGTATAFRSSFAMATIRLSLISKRETGERLRQKADVGVFAVRQSR